MKPKGQKKILIVDDDKALAEVIAESLDPSKYEIIMSTSGEGALKFIQTLDPHFVILDLILPKMSGIEVANRITALGKKNLPILFLSGSPTFKDVFMGKLSDAHHYFLDKPFSRTQLMSVIDYYFEKGSFKKYQKES